MSDLETDAIMADLKRAALSDFLGESMDDIEQSKYDDSTFEIGNREYLVLTDVEADEKALESITDSLWAFNAEFIVSECGLGSALVPMIRTFQEEKCESANDAIKSLVEKRIGLECFAQEAIRANGRGHFLSRYDEEENEQGQFFIYRTN